MFPHQYILVRSGLVTGLFLGFGLAKAEVPAVKTAKTVQVFESSAFSLNEADIKQTSIRLQTDDQMYAIRLWSNRAALGATELDQIDVYAGKIVGVERSWARLVQANGHWTGAVFDGEQLFLIDEQPVVAALLDTPVEAASTDTLMYRAADVELNESCATEANGQQWFDALDAEGPELLEAEVTRVLQMKVFVSQAYIEDSQNPQAEVVAQLNTMQGIFEEQLGLQIDVVEINFLNSPSGLISNDASVLLNQFTDFSRQQGNPGLNHLMAGRNALAGGTAGIAFVGAACTQQGTGVSETGGTGQTGALVMAHEIGHNLGAPHDNQAQSPCEGTPGTFLMNPSINNSSTFSDCSLAQMEPNLDRGCFLTPVERPPDDDNPPPDPEPEPDCIDLSSTRAYSQVNEGTFEVTNEGCSLLLFGNVWRQTTEIFTITPNSVLTFTVSLNRQGEIFGVGLDENRIATRGRLFQLEGTQNFGIRHFRYTQESGEEQTFSIPVGRYFSGEMSIVFANDDDEGGPESQMVIKDVRLTEQEETFSGQDVLQKDRPIDTCRARPTGC